MISNDFNDLYQPDYDDFPTEMGTKKESTIPAATAADTTLAEEVEEIRTIPIRENFPVAGSTYSGGESDGIVYTSIFGGTKIEHSYAMICQFLKEEGYGDIPLPKDLEELQKFRLLTRNKQILLFEDNGYVHNPIKILFPVNRRNKRTLILEIFNEHATDHLLRFHNRLNV